MLTIEPGRPMRQHATKMGKRTAFHREAERVRAMNEKAATVSEIYYADAQIKELKRMAKNSQSERRKRFERAFIRRSHELKSQIDRIAGNLPVTDEAAMLALWEKMLIRDDDRAYGADRTRAVRSAEIGQWMWWTKLIEYERFDLVELSKPVKSERNRLKIIFGL